MVSYVISCNELEPSDGAKVVLVKSLDGRGKYFKVLPEGRIQTRTHSLEEMRETVKILVSLGAKNITAIPEFRQ